MSSTDNTGLGLFDDAASAVGNFPTALRGYDRTAVDDYVRTLEASVVQSRRRATQLEQQVADLQDQVAAAATRAGADLDYTNLGGRAYEILRLAEEQAREVVENATIEAEQVKENARREADSLRSTAAREGNEIKSGGAGRDRQGARQAARRRSRPRSRRPRPSPRHWSPPPAGRPSRCAARPTTRSRPSGRTPTWTPRTCAARSSGRSRTSASGSRSSASRRSWPMQQAQDEA